jgi:hypothetical protein
LDFGSASFECGAVSLAAFQKWVASGIPRSVVRAKGFVTFLEEPEVTHEFHLSGKRRVEIEPAEDLPTSARRLKKTKFADPRTRLVLIGPGLDTTAALQALREMDAYAACFSERDHSCAGNPAEGAETRRGLIAERRARAVSLVAGDPRFELVEEDDRSRGDSKFSPRALEECVHFRLTGARLNSMASSAMEREHGVDFNRVNLEFVRALNSAGLGATATATTRPGWTTHFGAETLIIRVAAGRNDGEGGCLDMWEEVGRISAAVLERHIAHIPKCRCGF